MKINKRSFTLILFDLLCFAVINGLYYLLSRYLPYSMPVTDWIRYLAVVGILYVSVLGSRFLFRMYFAVWRYTSTYAYFRLILAEMCGGVVACLICYATGLFVGVWYFLTVCALDVLMILSARYCYRIVYKRRSVHRAEKSNCVPRARAAIVGAGQIGAYLVNELSANPKSVYTPVCFVDTDHTKIGKKIAGLKVYEPNQFAECVRELGVSEIIVAIKRVDSDMLSRLHTFYESLGCKLKIYDSPFHSDAADGEVQKRVIRDFRIEDLLFRQQMSISDTQSAQYYRDKVILVTGGGGSIGSELCRQIAKCSPKHLIIFDIYENNAYEIQQELVRKYGDTLKLSAVIGSVRDRRRLACVFERYRPQIVFHAAAHKHVPLMEDSGGEAIKNNVLGTYNTADMAEAYGVEKFVLISTDKAVNPTNIMGASKRLCEMVIQCRADSATSFVAVRFGNVLGSNGSVIPLFQKQIEAGGPVTLTDRRIIRYFMTIPEASQLVMQAGTMAKKGELFVLDMGKPVRIYDLAENMIKLSGLVPHVDIEIKEIGLRPGEKLYEELLMKTETLDKTAIDKIFIERDTPLSREQVENKLLMLQQAVDDFEVKGNAHAVHEVMKQVVPTFHLSEELNCQAESSDEMKMSAERTSVKA